VFPVIAVDNSPQGTSTHLNVVLYSQFHDVVDTKKLVMNSYKEECSKKLKPVSYLKYHFGSTAEDRELKEYEACSSDTLPSFFHHDMSL
jgi:hypothetical protein